MSTKDVLEALAAGAGRQSAIGGLMFQDAQKREAQGYELALQKEKWRRSGETSALENAMKGYKANWESYTKTFNKLNEIYWRAKSGQASENFDLTTTDLTELNNERLKYWDLSQHSKKKFLEYSGITYDPESMPTGGPGGETEATAEVVDAGVEAVSEQYGDAELAIIEKKIRKGGDFGSNEAVENYQAMLVEQGRAKLRAEGDDPRNYSYEQLLEQFGMTAAEEKEFRKKIRKVLERTSKAGAARVSLDKGGYPQGEPTYLPPNTPGFVKPSLAMDSLDALPQGNVDAYGDPIGVQDPDYIKKAEERALKRGQEKGTISQADFGRAYIEAQQALTQILTQTGTITKEQFMALVQQNEAKGIKLKAYQKAFQDIMKNR
jgi:hypothetical protein